MVVLVLNKHGKPLMPCSPAKARRLLDSGNARVVAKNPFRIKLLFGCGGAKQEVIRGEDIGSKTIGNAVIANGKVMYQSEVTLRGEEIKAKLEQRSSFRRNRRGRLRYRKPRFLNRSASIAKGRLLPSVRHKVEAHLREEKFIKTWLPVSKDIIETCHFDIHKITNPEVQKKGYQQGCQLNFYNVKAYVLSRDHYACQKCKVKNKGVPLHVHHIVFQSNGGTNAPDNLITLCKPCHNKLHAHKNAIKESLKIKTIAQKNTKHATEVSVVCALLRKCRGDFQETFGYITKFNRENMGWPKGHSIDAVCIASQGEMVKLNSCLYMKRCVAKGDYKQSSGSHSQFKIPTGKIFGLRKYDLIHVKDKNITGFIKGKRSSGFFAISDIENTSISNGINIKKNILRIQARNTVLIWRRASSPCLKVGGHNLK